MSPMKRRTRLLRVKRGGTSRNSTQRRYRSTGKWEEYPPGTPPQIDKFGDWHGNQITDSEGHRWPPNEGGSDVGGPFFTQKRYGTQGYQTHQQKREAVIPSGTYDRYRWNISNAFACPIETLGSGSNRRPNWPTVQESTESTLNALGAKAVSIVRPTAGETDLSTAIGELMREGLPSLIGARSWRERTFRLRNAGDEYLNVEFGWEPIVREVTSVGNSLINSDRLITQYERDIGRLVRRQYRFPEERSVTSELLGTSKQPDTITYSSGLTGGTAIGGRWTKQSTVTKRRWFSGAFRYGTPLPFDKVEKSASLAQKADHLLGLSLTPDVLWNLTPWSWALDWFANTGDVLSYASDVVTHGLVMQYGYIMEHTVHEVVYSLDGAVFYDKPVIVPKARLITETKRRREANPFGFGITWDGLSAGQAAVLAALGISRKR